MAQSIQDFTDLVEKAHVAGVEAAKACRPARFDLVAHANPLDDNSPVVEHFPDQKTNEHAFAGACGFAWVKIRPANGPLAKWMKSKGIGDKDDYQGGWVVWIGSEHVSKEIDHYGQSMEIKYAYANAYAKVLSEAGHRATAFSRLD